MEWGFDTRRIEYKPFEGCANCDRIKVLENLKANLPQILADRGISKRFLNSKIEDFPESVQQQTQNNDGLYIYGPCGTGKTHLTAALLRKDAQNVGPVLFKEAENRIGCRDSYREPKSSAFPLFISAPDLLLKIRGAFKNNSRTSEEEIVSEFTGIETLYIDDLGVEKTTEWARQTLYLVIDGRYREMKRTIITSNLSLDDLADKLDYRIASRIAEMCKSIRLEGNDRRLKQHNEKKGEV